MIRRTVVVILGLQMAVAPLAAANYICVADQAVGFFFNKYTKRWQTDTFNVKDEKYTLTTEDGKRVWKKLGDPLGMRQCQENNTYVFCDMLFLQVAINKENLRYQITYKAGYVDGLDSTEDTPFIQIGRCSSM